MAFKVYLLFCFLVIFVDCHPTMYKYNQNKMLEPDLIPVSSTVIPLPVYKVEYEFGIASPFKDEKIKKPEGPIQLLTVHSKKKPIPGPKVKRVDENKQDN